jgi:glutamate/aspartate transport system substrate-binding protein
MSFRYGYLGVLLGLALASGACVAQHAKTPVRAASKPKPAVNIAVSASPTLQRIAQNGVIRVGYIPTPGTFAFQRPSGETVGYSIDICQHVIGNVRTVLGNPDLQVNYRPLKPSERIPLLKSGEIDIECGGNTNTIGRQKDVAFSHTFFVTGARLLAHKSLKADKNADLWKRKIAVSKGTTAEAIVNRLKQEQAVEVVVVNTDPEGLRLVEEGKVEAFAQDDILLYGLIAASAQKADLWVTGKFMSVEPYAFMVPKDDAPFRELIDQTTAGLMRTGEINTIYRKWFDTDELRIPMSSYLKENIRFPNKYGIP